MRLCLLTFPIRISNWYINVQRSLRQKVVGVGLRSQLGSIRIRGYFLGDGAVG